MLSLFVTSRPSSAETDSIRKLPDSRPFQIGGFSLSAKSVNRVLSRALIRLAPEDLEFTEIPIDDLPLYNRDLDANRNTYTLALWKESL